MTEGWRCSPSYLSCISFPSLPLSYHLCSLLYPSPEHIDVGCPSFMVSLEKWSGEVDEVDAKSTQVVWRSFKLQMFSITILNFIIAHFTGLLKS